MEDLEYRNKVLGNVYRDSESRVRSEAMIWGRQQHCHQVTSEAASSSQGDNNAVRASRLG